ncbi:right-handed parallel beta-helix repeat-containing protein [Lentisalinibacter salinarum]|uniref:hypothetical protein n=1 Tax=Lentisalinibacter salinarum TaxID=2992239 RepID=UPI0038688A3A
MIARITALTGLVLLASLAAPASHAETFVADPQATDGPDYYRNLLSSLSPGDTLYLPSGTYRDRLNLTGIKGTENAWITISGPDSGAPAVITTDSTCCNTVQLGDNAYIRLENLTVDSNSEALGVSIDAINAKGQPTHDIVVQDCVLQGVGLHQQTVGISTKSTAWNWTIRRNRIIGAGTGIYLGNSDGAAPFIDGLIENNLFVDTIGYNMQIKHQNAFSALAGMPASGGRTIIRDNVFLKRVPQADFPQNKVDGPRPNLLVGGFPESGYGSDNLYEIYGNFFHQNPDGEGLIQASGRVSIHDNIFVGPAWSAIFLVDHNGPLRYATVYNNTVYSVDEGVRFANAARERSDVVGNLVFAATPVSGPVDNASGNLDAAVSAAGDYVLNPSTQLGEMDFYPVAGAVEAEPLDLTAFSTDTDFALDFNRSPKGDYRYRGAYAGDGRNPGWRLDAALKQASEIVRPRPPSNVTAD